MAAAILVLQIAACIGFGAAVLRVLKIDCDLTVLQLAVFSFTLGVGVLGWLLFFLGIYGWSESFGFLAVLLTGVMGLGVFRASNKSLIAPNHESFTRLENALLLVLAVFLLLDLPEGLAPPGDGDTLAYHFAMVKQFLVAGRLEFVPRALDGAAPLLVQMTYLPVLALGGEKALTLWTMVSGWAVGAVLYVMCREHLGRPWSMAVALVFMTTPAMVYGSGSGQVEARNALFVMLGAFAVGRTMDRHDIRYLILAGLCAGFFMGGKYTGLLFATACGVTLLAHRQWLRRGAIFSIAALAIGWQWYSWNWLHTGDPVFPMLYEQLGNDATGVWNLAHQKYFKATFAASENAVPRNIIWFLTYPFKATLDGATIFESGRTGFGPYGLLALPFAVAGAWRFRRGIRSGPLLSYVLIVSTFYTLWFFLGGSQRVRHLLPVLPLLFLVLSIAAERFVAGTKLSRQLVAILGLTLVLQIAGQYLAALNPLRFVVGGESREQFLSRNVLRYEPVPWLNTNLGQNDRVLVQERTYLYYLDVPYYLAHQTQQALLDLRPEANDARRFLGQLETLNIKYLLVTEVDMNKEASAMPPLMRLTKGLRDAGCLKSVRKFVVERRSSRTLPGINTSHETLDLFHLLKDNCALGGYVLSIKIPAARRVRSVGRNAF